MKWRLVALEPMTADRAAVLSRRLDDSLAKNATRDETRAALLAVMHLSAQLEKLNAEEKRRSGRIIDFCASAGPILGFDGGDWHNVDFDCVLPKIQALAAQLAESQAAVADWEKWCRAAEAKLAAAQAEIQQTKEHARLLWAEQVKGWQADEAALQAEIVELRRKVPREPFDVRCADALADAVDALVRRKVIDSRSPAADALLDYRNPAEAHHPAAPAPLLAAVKLAVEALKNATGELDRICERCELRSDSTSKENYEDAKDAYRPLVDALTALAPWVPK